MLAASNAKQKQSFEHVCCTACMFPIMQARVTSLHAWNANNSYHPNIWLAMVAAIVKF